MDVECGYYDREKVVINLGCYFPCYLSYEVIEWNKKCVREKIARFLFHYSREHENLV